MFNLGDRVKVKSEVNQDKELGSRGLASRYGYIEKVLEADSVIVKFHDFQQPIPTKYLTLIEAAKNV